MPLVVRSIVAMTGRTSTPPGRSGMPVHPQRLSPDQAKPIGCRWNCHVRSAEPSSVQCSMAAYRVVPDVEAAVDHGDTVDRHDHADLLVIEGLVADMEDQVCLGLADEPCGNSCR